MGIIRSILEVSPEEIKRNNQSSRSLNQQGNSLKTSRTNLTVNSAPVQFCVQNLFSKLETRSFILEQDEYIDSLINLCPAEVRLSEIKQTLNSPKSQAVCSMDFGCSDHVDE